MQVYARLGSKRYNDLRITSSMLFRLESPRLTMFSLPLTAAAGLSLLAELGWGFEWARLLAMLVGLLPGFA
jgi:hypothetical protein